MCGFSLVCWGKEIQTYVRSTLLSVLSSSLDQRSALQVYHRVQDGRGTQWRKLHNHFLLSDAEQQEP